MSTYSKNHHFNPQSVLKRFSLAKEQVVTLDKTRLTSFISPVRKTGSENYFNTIRLENQSHNFENIFDINDSILSTLLDEIILKQQVNHLTIEQQRQLASVIAHQIIRTKRARTEASDFINKVNVFTKEVTDKMGATPKLIPEFQNEEEEKLITIIKLKHIQDIIDSLLDKHLVLIDANNSEEYLWTSDNPVVLNNSFKYGRIGLNQKGIEVYYPISRKYAIGYFCKTTAAKLEFYRNRVPIITGLLDPLKSNGNLIFKDENVNFLNHLQLVNSSRFVYAPENRIEHAIKFLKNNEKYRLIKSKIGTGKEVATNLSLPTGHVLVFYTKDKSFMIKAEMVAGESELTIQSSELRKFILMTDNDPLERLEYYKDQNLSRGMSEIEIKSIDVNNNELIIAHSNPAIGFLIDMVKNKREKKKNVD